MQALPDPSFLVGEPSEGVVVPSVQFVGLAVLIDDLQPHPSLG